MKFFERRGLVNGLLVASVLLNVAMLGLPGELRGPPPDPHQAEPGSTSPAERAEFQEERRGPVPEAPQPARRGHLRRRQPDRRWGPGPTSTRPIHNRGIGGETTSGLLRRLDEITEDRPRKLVLLIGTNDLAAAVPPARIVANYRAILERIRAESPATETVVIGVLPVNRTIR